MLLMMIRSGYLPKHILYRQKEQFSDGVGYSWIDGLKDHASKHVSHSMLANASFIYPENTPTTKEGYYYRAIFEKFFPKSAARQTVPGGPNVAWPVVLQKQWSGMLLGLKTSTHLVVLLLGFIEAGSKDVNSSSDSCQVVGGQDGVVTNKTSTVV